MNENLPVLDELAALEATDGDDELVKILQETCLEEAPALLESARDAVHKSDWVTARRCGHSLKSSFGAIGAKAAAAKATELEFLESDKQGDFHNALDSLDEAYQQLVDRIG